MDLKMLTLKGLYPAWFRLTIPIATHLSPIATKDDTLCWNRSNLRSSHGVIQFIVIAQKCVKLDKLALDKLNLRVIDVDEA